MSGLCKSAVQLRIEEQLGDRTEVFRNVNTGKRFRVVLEAGGAVELSGMDGRSTYTSREKLSDPQVWERVR